MPHVPLVVVDELDTLSGEGLKAFKEISGMLDSKKGRKPLRVNISTRKTRYGLMENQLANAQNMGKTVKRWTALEFMERCPDSRSGTIITEYYVNTDDGVMLSEAEWKLLSDNKKKEYEVCEALDKCRACPLGPWCRGDSKKQKSQSNMLKSVNEVAAKVLSEGPDWTSAQLFNLKPSVEGIIFKEFEERLHVKNWNEMWLKLTGREYPGVCNHDTFVLKCQQMKLQCYAGIDFGWSSPSTVVVFYIDSKDNVYVVHCSGVTYRSSPEWIYYIATKIQPVYKVQLYSPDPADPGNLVEMRKLGLPTNTNVDKGNVGTGVQIIKKWLRAPQTMEPKIFLADEKCKPLIEEFKLYHFKTQADGTISEDIDTEHDHYIDALRYPITSLFGKNLAVMSNSADLDMSDVLTQNGQLLKAPSPAEFAKILGINNTEQDLSKLGKIGRLSALEDQEDDCNESFLWSM
jgi:hypothetical protein